MRPPGSGGSVARPRFPYIEATDSRINFKDGVEKKPFSLMNAEFSMWQANCGRMAAPSARAAGAHRPRTPSFRYRRTECGRLAAPRAVWTLCRSICARSGAGPSSGQVTRLFAGMDSGWRGDLDVTVGDSRRPRRSQAAVEDSSRRSAAAGIPAGCDLDVDATCRSHYHRANACVRQHYLFLAGGERTSAADGQRAGLQAPKTDLQLEINQVPSCISSAFS